MSVDNIQFWADTLEAARLPEIAWDIDTLEQGRLATDALLSSKIQEFGDRLDANAVDASVAQADADNAQALAAQALAASTSGELATKAYLDALLVTLRSDISAQLVAGLAAISSTISAQVTSEVSVISPTVDAAIAAANAQAGAMVAILDTEMAAFTAVTGNILDGVVPLLTSLQGTITTKVDDYAVRLDNLLVDFVSDDLNSALDDTIAAAASATAISAASASASAATAIASNTVAARMTSGKVSKNPIFSDWPAGTPANVTVGTGGTSSFIKDTTDVRYVNALQLNGTDDTANAPYVQLHTLTHALDCVPSPERVLVRAEVELVSGSISGGACFLASWDNTTGGVGATAGKLLNAFMTNEVGKVQAIEWYVERPVTYAAGTTPFFHLALYAISNLLGATRAACTLKVHRLDFEVVTANSMASLNMGATAALEGIQSSMFAMRVISGDAEGSFELVAMSSPTGSASVAKLSAKHFEIQASSVRISDNANIFPDFNMADPLYYSSPDAAVIALVANGQGLLGKNQLTIATNAGERTAVSGWFTIEPSTEYLASGACWLGSAGTGTTSLYIVTASLSSAGVISILTSTLVDTRTALGFALALASVAITSGSTARLARFKMVRSAGGTGIGTFGGLKLQKKMGSTLIVDGAIMADHLVTGTAVITESAQIAALTVDTLNIKERAVTLPEFSIIGSGSPVSITSDVTWTDAISVTISRTGISTVIEFNGQLDGVGGLAAFRFEVLRDGTLVGSAFEAGYQSRNSFALQVLDTDTGTGSTVYTVRVRLITGSVGTGRMYQRFLHAIQYKK